MLRQRIAQSVGERGVMLYSFLAIIMKKRESQQRAAHMGVIVSEIVGIYYIEILMDNHWQDSSEIWAMNVPLS